MKNFSFQNNKIAVAIFLAGLAIGGAIYLSQQKNQEILNSGKEKVVLEEKVKVEEGDLKECEINFSEAPQYVGSVCKVKGRVDHVYISKNGNIFINFCKDYKACPFYAVIFQKDASKFQPKEFEGREVSILGLIKTYQGRAEIVINEPTQIKIEK